MQPSDLVLSESDGQTLYFFMKQCKFELILLFTLNLLPSYLFLSTQPQLTPLTLLILTQLSTIWVSKALNVPNHFIVCAVILIGSKDLYVTVAVLSLMVVYTDREDKREVKRAISHDRFYDSEHDIIR